jgi:hypothetical protein
MLKDTWVITGTKAHKDIINRLKDMLSADNVTVDRVVSIHGTFRSVKYYHTHVFYETV